MHRHYRPQDWERCGLELGLMEYLDVKCSSEEHKQVYKKEAGEMAVKGQEHKEFGEMNEGATAPGSACK